GELDEAVSVPGPVYPYPFEARGSVIDIGREHCIDDGIYGDKTVQRAEIAPFGLRIHRKGKPLAVYLSGYAAVRCHLHLHYLQLLLRLKIVIRLIAFPRHRCKLSARL